MFSKPITRYVDGFYYCELGKSATAVTWITTNAGISIEE